MGYPVFRVTGNLISEGTYFHLVIIFVFVFFSRVGPISDSLFRYYDDFSRESELTGIQTNINTGKFT